MLKATPQRTPPPESLISASDFLAHLEDLSHDDQYRWALDTIEGISETVSKTGRVTLRQQTAIDNIVDSVVSRPRWR